ncbi:hypothetical protein [Brevundimonas sp. SL130]|uniref:hypothetical protein n=1 Tax=Brevundimonas sp. SL130 TaxID=2995143 RepID=UPI00226CC81F|nr:hypothetical protein [Brevundimonas sp. SL130]WAC59627.1 hypothetical protein OU998_15635 [Brevundimonas sp. SL130]
MSVTVTLLFDDNSFIEPGVDLQLLDGGRVVAAATTAAAGQVTFNIDPADLSAPMINLAPQQTPPA